MSGCDCLGRAPPRAGPGLHRVRRVQRHGRGDGRVRQVRFFAVVFEFACIKPEAPFPISSDFEYRRAVPHRDAMASLSLCGPVVEEEEPGLTAAGPPGAHLEAVVCEVRLPLPGRRVLRPRGEIEGGVRAVGGSEQGALVNGFCCIGEEDPPFAVPRLHEAISCTRLPADSTPACAAEALPVHECSGTGLSERYPTSGSLPARWLL